MDEPEPWCDWLVAPVTWDSFALQYWEKQPLVISRRDCAYYSRLLSIADFDSILASLSIDSPKVRVAGDAGEKNRPAALQGNVYERANGTEALFARLRNGETIIVHALHEDWKPLRELCRALAAKFSAPFQVNTYLTPAKARGLKPHYDTHDVFVLQIYGRKRWQLFDFAIELPLGGQEHTGEFYERKDPSTVVDLQPGDMIYIPRGWGHVADALDEMSLHLTVGAFPLNWAMLILKGVEQVVESDVCFRQSLPIGFAASAESRSQTAALLEEMFDTLPQRLNATALIDYAMAGAQLGRQPTLDGHLLDLTRLDEVSHGSMFRRRAGVAGRLSDVGADVGLTFHGKTVVFPGRFRECLHFVTQSEGVFESASLPGDTDKDEKLLVARKLVEEGFLTIAADG